MIRSLFLCILILAGHSYAIVGSNTIYYDDAQTVAFALTSVGFYAGDYQVSINRMDGKVNYIIDWAGENYSPDFDDTDIVRLLSSISAVGIVSEEASWHSDYVIVAFSNKVMICTTSAAQDLTQMSSTSDNDIMQWAAINMIVEDR